MIYGNFDRSKIFIGGNRFKDAQYTNTTGSEIELPIGRLFGRVLDGTHKVLPQDRTATNGSEVPRFVLAASYKVPNNTTITVSLCYGGDVAINKVVCKAGDTLQSILDEYMTSPATDYDKAGTLEDLLIANSHICLVPSTELTGEDNQ